MLSRTSRSSSITATRVPASEVSGGGGMRPRACRPAPAPARAGSGTSCRGPAPTRTRGRGPGGRTAASRSTARAPAPGAGRDRGCPPGRTPRICARGARPRCRCPSREPRAPGDRIARRTPTTMPPRSVYRMALATRLRSMRSRRCGSDRTTRAVGTKRSARFFSSAFEERSLAIRSKRGCNGTARTCAVTAPASRRETSSTWSKSVSSEPMDWLIRPMSSRLPGSFTRSSSAEAKRPSACRGWRRSWLAAARNRDLERFALSASRRRSAWRPASISSARDFSSTRLSSSTLSASYCLSVLTKRSIIIQPTNAMKSNAT